MATTMSCFLRRDRRRASLRAVVDGWSARRLLSRNIYLRSSSLMEVTNSLKMVEVQRFQQHPFCPRSCLFIKPALYFGMLMFHCWRSAGYASTYRHPLTGRWLIAVLQSGLVLRWGRISSKDQTADVKDLSFKCCPNLSNVISH